MISLPTPCQDYDVPLFGFGQVREELREYAGGVNGVPHFIINGQYHLSGAQDPDTFAQVLRQV